MNSKYQYYANDYHSLNRREYYERMLFPKNISLFNEIMKPKKNAIAVDIPVIFRGLSFGDSPQLISGTMGRPRFILENSEISSPTFFYKEKINDHRVITQLHFLNDEFFCAVYTFRHENNAERFMIKKMLFEKYTKMNLSGNFSREMNAGAVENHDQIVDPANNSISMFDNVNFDLLYLWGNEKIRMMVSSSVRFGHLKEVAQQQQMQKELLSKL